MSSFFAEKYFQINAQICLAQTYTDQKGGMQVDREKVTQYYEQHADTVMKAAWHFTGGIHAAQDCAEEAFLRLLQQEDMPDKKVLPWLLVTAVNLAKDYLRRHEHKRTVSLEKAQDMGTDDSALLAQRAAKRAVLSLPEKYRLPLMLHLAQGYTIEQTAKLIGKGTNTTGSLIRRGKKLLQKAYEKEMV